MGRDQGACTATHPNPPRPHLQSRRLVGTSAAAARMRPHRASASDAASAATTAVGGRCRCPAPALLLRECWGVAQPLPLRECMALAGSTLGVHCSAQAAAVARAIRVRRRGGAMLAVVRWRRVLQQGSRAGRPPVNRCTLHTHRCGQRCRAASWGAQAGRRVPLRAGRYRIAPSRCIKDGADAPRLLVHLEGRGTLACECSCCRCLWRVTCVCSDLSCCGRCWESIAERV